MVSTELIFYFGSETRYAGPLDQAALQSARLAKGGFTCTA